LQVCQQTLASRLALIEDGFEALAAAEVRVRYLATAQMRGELQQQSDAIA